MASLIKGGIDPYISADNLRLLCAALVELSDDAILMIEKRQNIITIGSKKQGWLGFIDVYNEEIVIYGKDKKPVAREEVVRLTSQQIRDKAYPKPTKIIKIITE